MVGPVRSLLVFLWLAMLVLWLFFPECVTPFGPPGARNWVLAASAPVTSL